MNQTNKLLEDQLSELLATLDELLTSSPDFSQPNAALSSLLRSTSQRINEVLDENTNRQSTETKLNDLLTKINVLLSPIAPIVQSVSSVSSEQRAEEEEINPHIPNSHKGSNKRLTPHQRRQVAIQATLQKNNTKVAKDFQITEGTVRKCLKKFQNDEEFLKSTQGKAQRKPAIRGAKFPETEMSLLKWIIEQRSLKLSVTMKDIQKKALELHSTCPSESQEAFVASTGWFSRFIARTKLSRRSPTHVMQQMRENVVEEIQAFWQDINKLRVKAEILRELGDTEKTLFLNIDEVPIFLDMSPNYTYHPQGARMIEVKRTKGGKMLSTALLGVFSTGLKLPIYWVTKGSNKISVDKDIEPYIIARGHTSGWMDAHLFKDWLKRLLLNLILPEKTHLVLILDQARIHLAAEVIDELKKRRKNLVLFHSQWLYVPVTTTGRRD